MTITISRLFVRSELATLGVVSIDDIPLCYSLEDPIRKRGAKIYGDTAIPVGVYLAVPREAGKLFQIYSRAVAVAQRV